MALASKTEMLRRSLQHERSEDREVGKREERRILRTLRVGNVARNTLSA